MADIAAAEAGLPCPNCGAPLQAERAIELLRDPARWLRMSEAAQAVASERFSAERIVPIYERFYETMLERNGDSKGPEGVENG